MTGGTSGIGLAIVRAFVQAIAEVVAASENLAVCAQSDEIAATALYLASDAGAFATGQTIVVDGGTIINDGS